MNSHSIPTQQYRNGSLDVTGKFLQVISIDISETLHWKYSIVYFILLWETWNPCKLRVHMSF